MRCLRPPSSAVSRCPSLQLALEPSAVVPVVARPGTAPSRSPSARNTAPAAVPPQASQQVLAPPPPQHDASSDSLPAPLASLLARVTSGADPKARLRLLLELGQQLPALLEEERVASLRVMGCTAQVWLCVRVRPDGRVALRGWSDSELSRGLLALLALGLEGAMPEQVLQLPSGFMGQLGVALGPGALAPSRTNGAANMVEAAKRRTRAALAPGGAMPAFPTLTITADALTPKGAFAEAQARYLAPDAGQVALLAELLSAKRMGVVAHFYMDPEVQGVLSSAAERWPHIHISDSLVMADTAVRMAEAGCTSICVLGVDFMSENVRAILDEAGHQDVKVYRMSTDSIGCSLAEAAESATYLTYLAQAGQTPNSLHVVYINTSLRTKALADQQLPTITCTSSNVVQTVLAAFAQVPEATVWYGPDTYMGRNLAQLLASLAGCSDEEVAALHTGHTADSIRAILPRLRYYDSGTCIVHHLFGGETCELVRSAYGDAYLAAHFEVPGEMFTLAMEAKRTRGMGVVGSTSNILDFIAEKVAAALAEPRPERLQFVLGTEAGMVTSIVRKVQGMLQKSGRHDVEVEIVFPVAPHAITTQQQATASGTPVELPGGLALLPGPASGEGCSLEGGCASCPYMKMNTLSALLGICQKVGTPAGEALLEGFKPRPYSEQVGGRSMAAAGCVPILHMRHFQKHKLLSDQLVADIRTRNSAAAGARA